MGIAYAQPACEDASSASGAAPRDDASVQRCYEAAPRLEEGAPPQAAAPSTVAPRESVFARARREKRETEEARRRAEHEEQRQRAKEGASDRRRAEEQLWRDTIFSFTRERQHVIFKRLIAEAYRTVPTDSHVKRWRVFRFSDHDGHPVHESFEALFEAHERSLFYKPKRSMCFDSLRCVYSQSHGYFVSRIGVFLSHILEEFRSEIPEGLEFESGPLSSMWSTKSCILYALEV